MEWVISDQMQELKVETIAWADQFECRLVLNQPVSDFNATQDLQFSGLSLSSISEKADSNGTIFDLILIPSSFTPGNLSVTLAPNSITDNLGVKNSEVSRLIDFRPHRVRETDLLLWWELNSSFSSTSFDPGTISGLQVWFDANDTSTLVFNGSNEISNWQDKSGNGTRCHHKPWSTNFQSYWWTWRETNGRDSQVWRE